ncbi:hypothetical protein PF008_g11711 [Phytophthora fragariae]|uniref:Uncharacterized protein n=1 Tax=Phytophthora fragariae TaxID=53985 RepID=A0A6G0RQ34_9STRA|nr:hypothetical protein PF008_g11711 [Phytophthora fragariae]
MTEAADYHALPEQGSFSGHGGERVSRRSSQGPSTTVPAASTDKASRTPTPLPSGSTDEALLELGDVDDDAVAVAPRGTPKALPSTFLGPGYGRNSYFTWRLRMSTLLVAALGVAGIVTFWVSKDVAHGGVYVHDVGYALAFHRTKTTACVAGTDYCGACDTIVVYAMLVYHVAPLLVLIGLPASGLRIFEPFRRRADGGGRQKIQSQGRYRGD